MWLKATRKFPISFLITIVFKINNNICFVHRTFHFINRRFINSRIFVVLHANKAFHKLYIIFIKKMYSLTYTGERESLTQIYNLRAYNCKCDKILSYFCNFHVFPKKLLWAHYPHIDLMYEHKSVCGYIDLKSSIKFSIDLIFSHFFIREKWAPSRKKNWFSMRENFIVR